MIRAIQWLVTVIIGVVGFVTLRWLYLHDAAGEATRPDNPFIGMTYGVAMLMVIMAGGTLISITWGKWGDELP